MPATIVLVHGAYADSSSWNGVLPALFEAGHRVVAFSNPLRSLSGDAVALTDQLRSVDGPVVLVGHSYGGAVMTNVPPAVADVTALVYVAGFALAAGESCADASELAPGGTLAETLEMVPRSDGPPDSFIAQDRFHQQFAADVPAEQARAMAVTQRPVVLAALEAPSGSDPLWGRTPSWFIWGELDHNIPAGAHQVMAERAGAKTKIEIAGASHVVGVSNPDRVAETILEAVSASAAVSA